MRRRRRGSGHEEIPAQERHLQQTTRGTKTHNIKQTSREEKHKQNNIRQIKAKASKENRSATPDQKERKKEEHG